MADNCRYQSGLSARQSMGAYAVRLMHTSNVARWAPTFIAAELQL